jgi:hypothetical protein
MCPKRSEEVMAGRKDVKDGQVVKGVSDGQPYVCFMAEQEFVARIDAVAAEGGPVPMNRSATIRLLIEIALTHIESSSLGAVCDAMKRLQSPRRARSKPVSSKRRKAS